MTGASLLAEREKVAGVPEIWFGSEEQRALRQRLSHASRRTLLLDYDGTLAPFHADKMQAFPYPGVSSLLERLRAMPEVRLVLVTGRRAADLEHLVHVAGEVEIWGSHGREHIDASRKYTLYRPTAEQIAALEALRSAMEASLAGVTLRLEEGDSAEVPEPMERKPASLAVHWRSLAAESGELLRRGAEAAYEQLGGGGAIERLPFASGVEFRASGYTKAFAVERVLERSGPDEMAAYLGDDLTDEDAFRAMEGRGVSVLVRPELRGSNARYWVRPPEELLRFLAEWGF